jgi:hypothetical protein
MPMRDDIVEIESPETGTPLPDSYQAAPPAEVTGQARYAASRRARPGSTPAPVLSRSGSRQAGGFVSLAASRQVIWPHWSS